MPSCIRHCFDFCEKYTDEDLHGLEKLHTKQLLKKRDDLYYISEYCGDCCSKEEPECRMCMQNRKYNMQHIKKTLNTREHVLNKAEAKILRKQRIKQGR